MKFSIYNAVRAWFLSLLFFAVDLSFAHTNSLNEVAVKACFDKVKSQACRYEGGHNDLYIGSCQYMADDLLCVRNQPIQKIDPDKIEHIHPVKKAKNKID